MSVVPGKGTVLSHTVATAYVVIVQVRSVDLPEPAIETFEADFLDNVASGIPYQMTGRIEGGSLGFELWYDESLASHGALTALFVATSTTLLAASLLGFQVSMPGNKGQWSFLAPGLAIGGSVPLADGITASATAKVSGNVTIATGA